MTFQFKGTLKYRFRLSLFGYDIFAGPWTTQAVNLTEAIPSEGTSVTLPDGFSGSVSEVSNGMSLTFTWEGLPLLSETIPLAGSLPVSLQPLKGVILAGTASVGVS